MTTSSLARILIVGGSSGIGLATAALALDRGAAVVIAGRSRERLDAAASSLPRAARLRTVTADVGREEDVVRLFEEAGSLDHVVVCAADVAGAYAPLPRLDAERALALLAVKVLGAVLVAKHAAGQMRPGGSLVLTSGVAAERPIAGGSIVCAANGALHALVRALAIELAPLRVNAVSPGWIDTPIWDVLDAAGKPARFAAMAANLPAGRIGQPGDVAAAILSLTTTPHVTGAVLPVDGGQLFA